MLVSAGTWDLIVKWLLDHADRFGPWFAATLIVAAALCAALYFLGKVLEQITKLLEAYKNAGLPTTVNRERRAAIKKRQNFCDTVLRADLAMIAKKENWNDQYFTDLEADVEVEGRYYPTIFHRLIRRKVTGLRRVSSLIDAIETSTERSLLVIGEPGSGKSVALRHLANQMVRRGSSSSSSRATVPLYINLKELVVASGTAVDADTIRRFVIDNVRRGDSDTAAFLRDNWNDYRDRGTWFFLFDSFDEIPAVLHAPSGSGVIRGYAEAIRQFANGVGECRSVLASREFKGPDQMPWQRLRILPLSERRQRELIDNSFLNASRKDLVKSHIAATDSSLYQNPMFLTLLCRYAKDVGGLPNNDLDLLSGHITRLAERDEEYMAQKYGVTSSEMVEAATQLAVLFGETPALGLAPTRDEIAAALRGRSDLRIAVDVMLPALVDSKIGRADVEEARPGDRRFTFSHRRYQETLLVNYLIAHPEHMSRRELLTDTRWREYAVTLLQSQGVAGMAPLLAEAESLLMSYATRSSAIRVQDVATNLTFHLWKSDEVHLLRLLQEGLSRRLDVVPESLNRCVAQLLEPRWANGDILDRVTVMQVGGLLPRELLTTYMMQSVRLESEELQGAAFRQAVYLRQVPEQLAAFVRRKLVEQTLEAKSLNHILRLKALTLRLPASVCAPEVVERARLLRAVMMPFRITNPNRHLLRYMRHGSAATQRPAALQATDLMMTIVMPAYMAFLIGVVAEPLARVIITQHPGIVVAALFYLAFAVGILSLWAQRSEPRFSLPSIAVIARPDWSAEGVKTAAMVIGVLVSFAVPGFVIALLLRFTTHYVVDIFTACWVSWVAVAVGFTVVMILQDARQMREFDSEFGRRRRPVAFQTALAAPSVDALVAWIRSDATWITADGISSRSLLRAALWRYESPEMVTSADDPAILRQRWSALQLRRVQEVLLNGLDAGVWLFQSTVLEATGQMPSVVTASQLSVDSADVSGPPVDV